MPRPCDGEIILSRFNVPRGSTAFCPRNNEDNSFEAVGRRRASQSSQQEQAKLYLAYFTMSSEVAEFVYEALERGTDIGGSAQRDSVLLNLVDESDWVGALTRITSHPNEAVSVGMQGRSPLHVACDHDAPAVVVQALLRAYPEASTRVGTSNMNPLHITCSSQHASVQVVQVLLKGGLELQSSMRDVDGDTPLAAACRCKAPIEVLEVLVRANPSAVRERDYEGLTPLLRLWVRYFVILGNDIIDAVQGREDLTGELGEAWNKTELLLRAAYHGSLQASSRNSMFRALHATAAVDCPRQIVKIAAKVYPGQLDEVDENGRIPLTIAAVTPAWKMRDLTDEGYLLEDRIHGDVSEYDDVDDAEQVGPNSLYPSVIEILVNAAPETARFRDADGRLPLQLAISRGKKWTTGVRALLEAYPDAMVLHDPVTNLLPFMLAGTVKKGGCTTIFQLLKTNPSLSQSALEHVSYR